MTQGSFVYPEYYMEFKFAQEEAMKRAREVIDAVFTEFEQRFGRRYEKVSAFMAEDADVLLLTMGSMSGTAREAVRRMRERGKKVGLLKLTVLRPFPFDEIRKKSKNAQVLAVVDRNVSLGFGGAVFGEVATALINEPQRPKLLNFIVGLGGRDVVLEDFYQMVEKAEMVLEGKEVERVNWVNVDAEAVRGGG